MIVLNILKKIIYRKSIIIFLIIHLILTFHIILADIVECTKNKPILISNECKLEYCTKKQFESKECIINNTVVKNQWLNNIIFIGDKYYRYINFATYSNGDMVVETTSSQPKRIFYGIKRNGRPYFTNKTDNTETSYYYIYFTDENIERYESDGIIIKPNDENEYYFSVSGNASNAEIFDFNNEIIYYKQSNTFVSSKKIISLRNAFFQLININYNYFFGFIADEDGSSNIYFQKHQINTLNNFKDTDTKIDELKELNAYGKGVSCAQSSSGLIYCLFMDINEEEKSLIIAKYESNFTGKISTAIGEDIYDENIFLKCVLLKDEIIIFSYYSYISDDYYPILLFRKFNIEEQKFDPYIPDYGYFSGIKLEIKDISNNILLNDIISVNKKKLAFSTVSKNKEILYIILINFYKDEKVKIRYYSINLYSLYHYKVFSDLRIHKYNNFIALGSSFCHKDSCIYEEDENFSVLMVFSYPNSTDTTINLEDLLFKDNLQSLDDVEIDFRNLLIIENNIFGLIFSNVIIDQITINGDYALYSSKDNLKVIENNWILEEDENIKIKYNGNENYYPTLNIVIQYYFNVTEPELDIYNTYQADEQGDNDDDLFERDQYAGRLSYYNIQLNNQLTSECNNINCVLCYKLSNNFCISCKYNYSLSDDNLNNKICDNNDKETEKEKEEEKGKEEEKEKEKEEEKEKELEKEEKEKQEEKEKDKDAGTITNMISETLDNIMTQKLSDDCTIEGIIMNKYCNGFITDQQMVILYNEIKKLYLNSNYDKNNTIFQTKNIIIQLSKLEDQKESYNSNISSIDLGKCEERLRFHYNIPKNLSLIILKLDKKNEDLTKTYVGYELYNPLNLSKLNLSFCREIRININTPFQLNDDVAKLYDSLKESGYNLFNENDSFYNDICSIYTSLNGSDITLADRKQIFSENGNITLCQSGCEFEYYNSRVRSAKCNCIIEENGSNEWFDSFIDKFEFKLISENFLNTIKHSNFLVLKCFNIAIDLTSILSNIGRFLMAILVFLTIILLLYFCVIDIKTIDKYIKYILKKKLKNSKYNKSKDKKEKLKTEVNKKIKNDEKYKKNQNEKLFFKKSPKKQKNKFKDIKKESKLHPPKKNCQKNNEHNVSKISDNNATIKNFINENLEIKNSNKKQVSKNSIKKKEKNINNAKIYNKSEKEDKIKRIKSAKNDKKKDFNNTKINNNIFSKIKKEKLNDFELNSLEYKKATIIDKRTYWQYYWSLLKKKHLIVFTFHPNNDYNLSAIKLSLFLISFSLYFAINGFFFDDSTMHHIYVDSEYSILNQIPQIVISTICSAIINILLKALSLSEPSFIAIKAENDIKKFTQNSYNMKKVLKLKFSIFFILDILLLLLFFYFISCFCGVYPNTQLLLIQDTLVSFGLSTIYPFALYLLPGLFRIPSLKAPKKDKQCMYKISNIIALF